MFLIKKEVAGNNFYWNVENEKWQGLIDNATKWVNVIDAKKYLDSRRFVNAEIIKNKQNV